MVHCTVLLLAALAAEPGPPVTVSPETTYLTEPLRPDGSVDYVAALNARLSEGVTPENNAVVPFVRAVGPGEIGEERRAEYFAKLGIEPLPEDGEYLVSLGAFVDKRFGAEEGGRRQQLNEEVFEQLDAALARPWTADQYPIIANWIAANQQPLKLIHQAAERRRWYNPLIPAESQTHEIPLDGNLDCMMVMREAARLLRCRAILHLGQGDEAAAWNDLIAVHRLGRLMSQGPFLIDLLVAYAIEAIAVQGEAVLAHFTEIAPQEARRRAEQLKSLPRRRPMVDVFALGERVFTLSYLPAVARDGIAGLDPLVNFPLLGEDSPPLPTRIWRSARRCVLRHLARHWVDWDLVARRSNGFYDQAVAVLRADGMADRAERLGEIVRSHQQDDERWLALAFERLLSGQLPGRVVSEATATRVLALLSPVLKSAYMAEIRQTISSRQAELAFPLAAYRTVHGEYPERLDAMGPEFVDALPADPYADEPMRYRRTDDGCILYSVGPNGRDDGGRNATWDWDDDSLAEDADDIYLRLPPRVR